MGGWREMEGLAVVIVADEKRKGVRDEAQISGHVTLLAG
jgi:hypothetical protein